MGREARASEAEPRVAPMLSKLEQLDAKRKQNEEAIRVFAAFEHGSSSPTATDPGASQVISLKQAGLVELVDEGPYSPCTVKLSGLGKWELKRMRAVLADVDYQITVERQAEADRFEAPDDVTLTANGQSETPPVAAYEVDIPF